MDSVETASVASVVEVALEGLVLEAALALCLPLAEAVA